MFYITSQSYVTSYENIKKLHMVSKIFWLISAFSVKIYKTLEQSNKIIEVKHNLRGSNYSIISIQNSFSLISQFSSWDSLHHIHRILISHWYHQGTFIWPSLSTLQQSIHSSSCQHKYFWISNNGLFQYSNNT